MLPSRPAWWLLAVVVVLAGCGPGASAHAAPRPRGVRLPRWAAERRRPGRVVAAGRPLVLGHRGGQERGYQNSMAAFDDAIALHLDAIETDVRHSADGVAVLQHDPELPRACDRYRGRPVRALTAAQLATVRCGGQPIVTLERLVRRLERPDARQVGLMAEVKDVDPLGVRQAVAPLGWNRVIIESFHWAALERIHVLDPRVVTCPLGVTLPTLRPALAVAHGCVAPDTAGVTRQFVRAAHADGAAVIVWTVDDPVRAADLAALGVDGIITDRPRAVAARLDRPGGLSGRIAGYPASRTAHP